MIRSPVTGVVVLLALAACEAPETSPPTDLMDATYLIVSPVEAEELTSPVTLGGESRPALVAPLPSEFRYRVEVPERARLTFAIGIANAPGASDGEPLPGNRMRFAVRAGERTADELVFEREIHVARRDQWIEQQVDLGAFSGREIWLVFEVSLPGAESSTEPLPVVGAFGEPILHDRARYREGRGVVVVSIDTLRRDHVSLYGYPRDTTPGLAALATEAVVFEDAVSTSSWTLPAHASLFTSNYPSAHGAVNLHVGLSPSWPTLVTELQANDFTTQAFVTHVYLSREYGFGEGYDHLEYLPETRAEQVTDRAVRFLSAMGDRDFFLFVHYYDPHWHYDPPAPYDTTFDPAYEGHASGIWWEFKKLDAETINPRDLHHIKALYDGEIRYTDHHVERLMREMKQLGVFDKSLIVVTSDHGEEFLEHGSWEHQKTLYEEQLRIPLIVKLPYGKGAGRQVDGQVSLLDVAPTVIGVLGLTPPPSFRGRDLFDNGSPERRESWAETEHTIDGSHKLALRLGEGERKGIFSLRDGSRTLELFDLHEDPGEHHPIEDERMRAAFEGRLETFLDRAARAREGRDETFPVELGPEERERLRSLGYVK